MRGALHDQALKLRWIRSIFRDRRDTLSPFKQGPFGIRGGERYRLRFLEP